MKIVLNGKDLADAVDLWLEKKDYKLNDPKVVFIARSTMFGNDTFTAEVESKEDPR